MIKSVAKTIWPKFWIKWNFELEVRENLKLTVHLLRSRLTSVSSNRIVHPLHLLTLKVLTDVIAIFRNFKTVNVKNLESVKVSFFIQNESTATQTYKISSRFLKSVWSGITTFRENLKLKQLRSRLTSVSSNLIVHPLHLLTLLGCYVSGLYSYPQI